MVGEVFQEYPSVVCPYQQDGMPGVLNYPMYVRRPDFSSLMSDLLSWN